VLPGLCFVNELISHDEALHCDFAGVLYSCLLKPPCSIHVREIIDSAIHVGSMRSEESGEKTRQSWGWGNISENEQCGGRDLQTECWLAEQWQSSFGVGMWRQWSPFVLLSFLKLTGCHRDCCSWQYMLLLFYSRSESNDVSHQVPSLGAMIG
jgi:hypothetical protein